MFLLLYYLLLCTEYQNVFNNNAYKDNESKEWHSSFNTEALLKPRYWTTDEWYMNKVKKDLFF